MSLGIEEMLKDPSHAPQWAVRSQWHFYWFFVSDYWTLF